MTHAYFGNEKWAEVAPGLKTLGEALDVRRRILRAFEAAELESAPEAQPRLDDLRGDRRRPDGRRAGRGAGGDRRPDPGARIPPVQSAAPPGWSWSRPARAFSPRFPEELSRKARAQLEQLGIEVRTGTRVTDLGDGYVEIGDECIATHTVLWAAGVRASPLAAQLGVPLDRAGRVWVSDDLSVPDRPERLRGRRSHRQDPGRQARCPASRSWPFRAAGTWPATSGSPSNGRPRLPFRYVDKGSMATIGRNQAVAQLGRLQVLSGFIAWWLWLTRSPTDRWSAFAAELAVLMEWALSYFTWQRNGRG